jgi:hypothetical protein
MKWGHMKQDEIGRYAGKIEPRRNRDVTVNAERNRSTGVGTSDW